MKLLTIGLDNAGKTTIIKRFNGEDIDDIAPTLGFDINTLAHRGYNLNIWDIGGQQTIRTYWRNYFEVTDGIIWVVDSADTWRLDTCRDELKELLVEEQLGGASLLIFANKQDLPDALSPEEIAKRLDLGAEQYKNRHYCIQGCSAQTGEGLLEGVDWVVNDIASRIMMR
mmetsp:Transcript_10264/g.31627  ORF Transcript_10264/g.31627 Transcript_10264/m.31627 type:complete len:170 (+) Transcript_10264:1-510(+)